MQKLAVILSFCLAFAPALGQEKPRPIEFKVSPAAKVDADFSIVFATNRSVSPEPDAPSSLSHDEAVAVSTFFRNEATSELKYGRYHYRFLASKHQVGAFDDTVRSRGRATRIDQKEAFAIPTVTKYEPEVLNIIHGYNSNLDTSIKQAVLFRQDLYAEHGDALPYFDLRVYDWPSYGESIQYTTERMDIKHNAPPLAVYLWELLKTRKPGTVNIVAHSMGNDVLLSAIEHLDRGGHLKQMQFGRVILAAPDVSQSWFSKTVPKLIKHSKKVVQYVSTEDKALWLSRWVNLFKGTRAGATVMDIKDLEVILCDEVTDPKDRYAHSYYASSAEVLQDIAGVLGDKTFKMTPDERSVELIEKRTTDTGYVYWAFK